MSDILWQPSPERIANTRMDQFRRYINQRYSLQLGDYPALHQWSIDQRADFWRAIVDYFDVQFRSPPTAVLIEDAEMPSARWFPGATLNFAEHLLRRRDAHTAVVAVAEDGQREQLTYAELAAHVAGLQRSLRAAGVTQGDRVAACMPNTWQTLVGMLATTSLGAIWSCSSPDFGTQGVIDRFGQIEPKVLITCAGYRYAGKDIDQTAKLNEILARLPSLEQLIIVPYAKPQARIEDYQTQARVALWQDFYQPGGEPDFVAVPFDHPLYILYSSGTTGVPKCIIHGTGGVLLTHLKEHGLHADLSREDCLFYYTTCGWMMWNWLVSVLAIGATAVLYDGSPFHPGPERLIDLIDAEHISVFGTSPKFLATLEKAGLQPRLSHDLGSLKALISTGSPLSPQSYDYVYREIKAELCLSSMSGGTDIVSCFVIGNPVLPVRHGEMQCKSLAMAIEVWDDQGRPLVGEKGELVCTRHFPAMPIGLWKDPERKKLLASYFSQFPGVWAQGDYAEQRPNGSLLIHGRSDAVLNPGGVRIGTAEIYRQVEKIPQVLESLAIGQRWQDDVRVVLFVRLNDGIELDEALEQQIRQVIRTNTTPRHVPAKILAVTDIPRTISGKIVELAVRNVVHGEPVKNTDALANPQALDQFRDRPELAQG
ncbi:MULTISPECIES: acetoacetate--CoA ligase [unclassified Pseudomonas]|uniref:acetoacetate--CoA ligase n=1 Tax=unclassified Pseudomonas TaxID=196821 RepID=UPI000C86C59D|nr:MULTISPECIES: acetoacetate--CoA ligase [unclassified Pseudomonas]PMV20325.1 acetoacetate--CoA ligase [Pseudomonas sp. FW305-3-2-15-C-TSA2]PMV21006.1 acetoacetate--CoA ligase [Pseudomonas sp. DP16D-L5]PMV36626.1 acetoacetate--CoA ligase [Pseudomonas sp. FW305-3-2-15-A-LB2]PMV43211.1 acetoacetate--CoA ligase [Pseudomonas sp. FW305-3-2-15-C-R2A1]PMV44105.1 acetoacetate--CoA ligase [Pseudomonas sp. FW305-3-2-15-C-LB1]